MTTPSERVPDTGLTAALRRALGPTPERMLDMPSALRSRLTKEAGPRAGELRSEIHLLVAAADEHLPQSLIAAAPLDGQQLEHLAQSLATTRGWSIDASRCTVALWADALDLFPSGAPGSEPAPAPTPERAVSAAPAQARAPRSDELLAATGTPTNARGVGLEGTVLPRAAATELPGHARLIDPHATVLPQLSSVVVPERVPLVGDAPPPADAPIPSTGVTIPWPPSKARALRDATALEGTEPAGAYQAFHPRSPMVRLWAALGLLLVGGTLAVLTKFLVGVLPVLLVGVLLQRVVPEGTLVVDEQGARYYRKLKAGAAPLLTLNWANARVTVGRPGRIESPQGTLWLMFGAGKVARAAQSRAGQSGTPNAPGDRL